jgi:hypothetical protein
VIETSLAKQPSNRRTPRQGSKCPDGVVASPTAGPPTGLFDRDRFSPLFVVHSNVDDDSGLVVAFEARLGARPTLLHTYETVVLPIFTPIVDWRRPVSEPRLAVNAFVLFLES